MSTATPEVPRDGRATAPAQEHARAAAPESAGPPHAGESPGHLGGVLQGYLERVEWDLRRVERELRSARRQADAPADAGGPEGPDRSVAVAEHVRDTLRSVRALLAEAQVSRP